MLMPKPQGITLLELLITLSIISILIMISLPMYTQYMTHEHRIEAEMTLEKLAASLEQYNTLNNTYQNATLQTLGIPSTIAKNTYHMDIINATDTDFFISATPSDDQAAKDPTCLTLSLNSKGEKGITGSGQINDCW
jgi:type IV pilus assembly protein PilE